MDNKQIRLECLKLSYARIPKADEVILEAAKFEEFILNGLNKPQEEKKESLNPGNSTSNKNKK